jgi:hypothetical protein
MPIRKRNVKRRGLLDADEKAWLNGDSDCGFVQFMPWEALEALWDAHGNSEGFVWRRGMCLPERR